MTQYVASKFVGICSDCPLYSNVRLSSEGRIGLQVTESSGQSAL